MISKIISGGQIGADVAGLKVAMDLGLSTGGMVPLGWKTKLGPRPELAKLGLVEHPSSESYRPRTIWNVKNSDATMIFATNFNSPGTILTVNSCKKYNKPYMLVDIKDSYGSFIFDVMLFFEDNNVSTLNVAGNSGKTDTMTKFIYKTTKRILYAYVDAYNKHYK